jgi:hypothetical protein
MAVLLAGTIYFSEPHPSPRWRLAFGATTYALAIVAALLPGWVGKIPARGLRLILASVSVAFMLGPTLFGSVALMYALVQLAGFRLQGSDGLLGVCLWVFLITVLALWVQFRRTAAHD